MNRIYQRPARRPCAACGVPKGPAAYRDGAHVCVACTRDRHGTVTIYTQRGCRCTRCVAAFRTYQREYRRAYRAAGRDRAYPNYTGAAA